MHRKTGAQSNATSLTTSSLKFTNTTNTVLKLSLLTLNVNGIKGKLTSMEFGDLCRM